MPKKKSHKPKMMENLSLELQESAVKNSELCFKASLLELEAIANQPRLLPSQISQLESMFEKVYMDLQPTSRDYVARRDAIDFVQDIATGQLSACNTIKHFGSIQARAFGSFTMDMFTPSSDLDISLDFDSRGDSLSRDEKLQVLRKLSRTLHGLAARGGIIRDVQPILKAKVPVVKFLVCETGIECDVSAENRDGVSKSDLLRIFSTIDPRFRKLCFLVKAWANAQGVNSSKDQTLNSLSLILFVAFHLQTRRPAILPPFSALLKGMQPPFTSDATSVIEKRVQDYKNFGVKNEESVVELFYSLLLKLVAVKNLWEQGLCASTYEGTWTWTSKPSWIFVEDFTALSQNAARAVTEKGFEEIYGSVSEAIIQLRSPGYTANTLESLLFSPKLSGKRGKRPFANNIAVNSEDEHQVFSRIASWITFGERHETMRFGEHGNMSRIPQQPISVGTDARAWDVTGRDIPPVPSYGTGFLSWQEGSPLKKLKLQESQSRQAEARLWSQRHSSSLHADRLVHYTPFSHPMLQRRPGVFMPPPARVGVGMQLEGTEMHVDRTTISHMLPQPYPSYVPLHQGGLPNHHPPFPTSRSHYEEPLRYLNPLGQHYGNRL